MNLHNSIPVYSLHLMYACVWVCVRVYVKKLTNAQVKLTAHIYSITLLSVRRPKGLQSPLDWLKRDLWELGPEMFFWILWNDPKKYHHLLKQSPESQAISSFIISCIKETLRDTYFTRVKGKLILACWMLQCSFYVHIWGSQGIH